jgi:hypothetical protein
VVDDDPMNMELGGHTGRLVRPDPARWLTEGDAGRLTELLAG